MFNHPNKSKKQIANIESRDQERESLNDNPAALCHKPMWTIALLACGIISIEPVQQAWERRMNAQDRELAAEMRKRFPNAVLDV